MKNFLLTMALAIAAQAAAFAQTYSFAKATGTYANITTPTVLSLTAWDEESYALAMPFTFQFGGSTVDTLFINDNGYIDILTATGGGWIDGMYTDLAEAASGTSTIAYQVTGITSNRILKVEWRNAGFYEGTASEFTNFQIWFYETNSNIQIHYGPSNIVSITDIFSASGGPEVGIITGLDLTAQTVNGIYLQGSGAAPTAVVLNNATSYPSLSSPPTASSIFNFSAVVSGIVKEFNNTAVSVYPNPATDLVTIKGLIASSGNVAVKITDTLGKTVLAENLPASNTINIQHLAKGTYLLEITSGSEHIAKRLVKL